MVPVLTVEQMRQLDEYVINRDDSGRCLMAHAGKALARELNDFERIAIICGPGNNGGDGYAAAYALQNNFSSKPQYIDIFYTKPPKSDESIFFFENLDSPTIRIFELVQEESSTRAGGDEALFATSRLLARHGANTQSPGPANVDLNDYDVVVDCLLGTGFSGVPRGIIKDCIEAINACNSKVIAMDINSGINGDTGTGEVGVRSDLTLTIGYPKIGMLNPEFKNWTREIHSANIGYDLTPGTLAPFKQGEIDFRDERSLEIVLL